MKKEMRNRKLLYIAALAAFLTAHLLTDSYAMLAGLLILLVMPVLSAAFVLAVRKDISIKIDNVKETLIRGEKVNLHIVVENNAYFMVSNIFVGITFTYSNDVQKDMYQLEAEVRSHEKTVIDQQVRLNYAGSLVIDLKQSFICDPLRLCCFSLQAPSGCKITVMPVLYETDAYAMYMMSGDIEDAQEYSKNRSGQDTSEIFDVRDYRNGDALNHIHWKLSAKENSLTVKEFSQPISRSNCILAELCKPTGTEERKNLNGIYEMAYAIGQLACLKEKSFQLAFYSAQLAELKIIDIMSEEELSEAVRIMIAEPAAAEPNALKQYVHSPAAGAQKLFYITSQIQDDTYGLLDQLTGNAYIYKVGDDADAGEVTRLDVGTLLYVNRDDIAWGISSTMI